MPKDHPGISPSPILALLVSQAIFGAWGVVARGIHLDGRVLVFIMAASAYLSSSFILARWRLRVPKRSLWVGLNLTLDVLLLIYAYRHLPLAVVITLHYMGPMIVQIMAPLALGERPSRRQMGLAAMGFLGGALIAEPKFHAGEILGMAAALGSAFTLAGNIILQKRRMLDVADPLRAVSEYNLVLALFTGATMFIGNEAHELFSRGMATILYAVLAGVLVQGAAMFLFNYSLTRMRGTVVAVVSSSEIVFAALFGLLIYHETLDIVQMTGMGLVIYAVMTLKMLEQNYSRSGGEAHGQ